MSDVIQTFSTDELERDRLESEADIKICQHAMAIGVTHHHDGLPVQHRLDTNRWIIERIDAELERRRSAMV